MQSHSHVSVASLSVSSSRSQCPLCFSRSLRSLRLCGESVFDFRFCILFHLCSSVFIRGFQGFAVALAFDSISNLKFQIAFAFISVYLCSSVVSKVLPSPPSSITTTNRCDRQLKQKRERLFLRGTSKALEPWSSMTRGSAR